MLIIIGGLPGVGKTTIAKKLAAKIQAVYLRIDSIEQALRNAAKYNDKCQLTEVIAEGYMAAYAVAKDNLELGLTVIADSVNSIAITREDYQKVAQYCNKPYLEVEIICSDKNMHRQRIETRKADLAGHKLPSWQDVIDREYNLWESKDFTIDTADTSVEIAVGQIIGTIDNLKAAH